MSRHQIQGCAAADLWRYENRCTAADVNLAAGLLGWWELTDNIGAIQLGPNPGLSGRVLVDESLGGFVVYEHDTTRGGPPGAALFNANDANSLRCYDPPLIAPDVGTGYFIHNPFTIGLWVRLDNSSAVNGVILTYSEGTVIRYKLQHMATANRFVFTVVGFTGNAVITAENFGAPTLGQWYWIELFYELETLIAGIRVTRQRTEPGEPMQATADQKIVPGGLAENRGDFVLGYYGSGVNFCFNGALAAVGFWDRALTDCERGRLNAPADYPFDVARLTETGAMRTTEDGTVRTLE